MPVMQNSQPPKSYATHSLVSGSGGNPDWILDFTAKEYDGRSTMNITLRASNNTTKGGLTITLPEDLGREWGFQKQSTGDFWFQIGTHHPMDRLAVAFARQFWDFLVSQGWKPVKEEA